MNLIINCTVTLSKKLEKLCSPDSPLFLSTSTIDKNKCTGILKIGVKDDVALMDIKNLGETSLMLKMEDVADELQELGDSQPVSNIYSGNVSDVTENAPPVTKPQERRSHKNVVNAIAVTNADVAVKNYKNASKYEAKHIANYDELRNMLDAMKGIDDPIPIVDDGKPLTRQKAIEREKILNTLPKIPQRAFIQNTMSNKLYIEDLDLALTAHEIFDISRKPPKLLKESRQLEYCCQRGLLKFVSHVSHQEYIDWMEQTMEKADVVSSSLPVFDNPELAMQNMEAMPDDQVESFGHSQFVDGKGKKAIQQRSLSQHNPKHQQSVKINSRKMDTLDDVDAIDLNDDFQGDVVEGYEDNGDVSINDVLSSIADGDIAIDNDIAQLAKDLPVDKGTTDVDESSSGRHGIRRSSTPLMSDEVQDSDKKIVRRIG